MRVYVFPNTYTYLWHLPLEVLVLLNARLNNHIRVVGEEVPFVRSVSIGIYIKNGSVDETPVNNGITHFIEHMLFKGTKSRTARQLADDMSRIGGRINAYTSKEYVCFYAHVLDEHLDEVIAILSDMMTNSLFSSEDIQKEKAVILEEYAMYEDTPEELVLDEMHSLIWQDQPIGYNIIGTKDNINSMTRDTLLDYIQTQYVGDNIVISVVGKIDFKEVTKKLEDAFAAISTGNVSERTSSIIYTPGKKGIIKEIEQGHLSMSYPTVDYFSKDTYGLNLLSTLLGGGLNSRLFQSVREDKSLCYSIYSYVETFYKTGLFTTYAATTSKQIEALYHAILDEILLLKKEGVKALELLEIKEQVKSNLIIGMESMSSRMSHYGKGELLMGKIKMQDEMLTEINKVTLSNIKDLIEDTFDTDKLSVTLVSPTIDVLDRI